MTNDLIEFVHEDGDLIIAECKDYYENALNRKIAPSDLEMLLINGLAYRELLIRTGINEAGRQNMVPFARGSALEYLGQLVGVNRLPASASLCTIEFVLVSGHTGIIIPENLRIQSIDGKVIFQTIEQQICTTGTTKAQLKAAALTPGEIGNGYSQNNISIILDPQAYISLAYNIDSTKGGNNEETDDELRERIMLAPATFSVAGPSDAYKYFAKSSHASIVDVAVTSPVPGQVSIFPLLENGEMPTPEILNAVQAICNSEKIRPMTDTVITEAPGIIEYNIEVNLTLLTTSVNETIKSNVEKNLTNFKESRKNKLGLDVVVLKLAVLSMIDGVYKAEVITPTTDIVADPNIYTKCNGIIVNIIGTHDE